MHFLDHMVRVNFVVSEVTNMSSKVAVTFCILSGDEWEFLCSTSSSAFGVPVLGHSNRCVMVSHSCFNLHFPGDLSCGASFHVLICICTFSLVRCLLRSLACVLIGLFVFLLNFKSSCYILNNGSLSDVSFANIFSQSVASLLISGTLPFTE